MRQTVFVCLVAAAVSLQACGQPKLSRGSARELLLKTPQIAATSSQLPLRSGSQKLGLQLELWNQELGLTTRGTEAIAAIDRQEIALRSPGTIELEVSGIAPLPMSEGMSEIEFSFQIVGLNFPVKALVRNKASGKSIARLFDDGWRIESIHFSWTDDAAPLSPSEAKNLSDQVEQVSAARNQRLGELETLLADSRTATARLYVVSGPMRWAQSTTAQAVVVTDVGIVAESVISVWAKTYSADQRLSREASYLYPFDMFGAIDPRESAHPNNVVIRIDCSHEREGGYCRELPMNNDSTNIYIHFDSPEAAAPMRTAVQEAYSAWMRKYAAARKEQLRLRALIAASSR